MDNIIINPNADASACVIWLHGLGADGHDFVPIVPQLNLGELENIRFIFPHAPIRPVTINGGFGQRAWFDITSIDRAGLEQDLTGFQASSANLQALVDEQVAGGIPQERIVLAGFSQGGAVALLTGLTSSKPFAGILALSTYLPKWVDVTNTRTPIFLAHGTNDPLLPYKLGEETCDALQNAGCTVAWYAYAMEHCVCEKEITDIGFWLKERLTETAR